MRLLALIAFGLTAAAIAMLAAAGLDADAFGERAAPAAAPCTQAYPAGTTFQPEAAGDLGPSARFISDQAGTPQGQAIEITIRKGSINPKSNEAPSGLNFRWRPAIPASARAACLTYRLWLPQDFAFNKGGKLPGLFGGDGPAGGRKADGSNGFSTRFMWRQTGAGEIYAYIPGHPKGRGMTIARGAWIFPRGRWVELTQEVVLNDPVASNGAIRVWIDGALKLQREGIVIRTSGELGFAGVMADIFYGGKGAQWAAPAEAVVRITPFDLRWR